MNIEQNLKFFTEGNGKNKGRSPNERYASFDYCFNYFQSFREKGKLDDLISPDNIQVSCLQLAFYLASWGMIRGSSFLLEKSIKFYEPLIIGVVNFDPHIWDIDVNCYTEENVQLLIACQHMIEEKLGKEYQPSDTLVTKIMLGIFGNVPAFDRFFKTGFHVSSYSKKSLGIVGQFYKENKATIDNTVIYTFDYQTAGLTQRKYTKAKVIDMIGFSAGLIPGEDNVATL